MGRLSDMTTPLKALYTRLRAPSTSYRPLNSDEPENEPSSEHPHPHDRIRRPQHHHHRTKTVLKRTMVISLFAMLGYLAYVFAQSSAGDNVCDTPEHGFQCSPDVSHLWGQYSPYFTVESDLNPAIPADCQITFAQVLSRHGARDPTLGKSIIYRN